MLSEAKLFMKLWNATSCYCIKIQTLLSSRLSAIFQLVRCMSQSWRRSRRIICSWKSCLLSIIVNLWWNAFYWSIQCQTRFYCRSIRWCSTNFGQHCTNQFTEYLFNKYRQATLKRVDIVSNIYLDHRTKNSTRNKRGVGKRIKVAGDVPISRQWKSFLCINTN